jgi:hypothetical protein
MTIKYYNEYDFRLAISKGHVDGHIHLHKYGRNPDCALNTPEAIWNGGGAYTGHNAVAAELLTVVSSDAADDAVAVGTGAWTVRLFGLDANWNPLVEDVILDGATPVDTVAAFIRMDRMRILTAGTGGKNAGSITVAQKVTTANVMAVMPIGYNSTMIAAWTIPAGFRGFFTGWGASLSGGSVGNALVRLLARPEGQTFQVQEELSIVAAGASTLERLYITPKGPYDEKTDVFIEATAGANGIGVAGSFDLLIVKEGF